MFTPIPSTRLVAAGKRFLAVAAMLTLGSTAAQAQLVSQYTFSQSTGTYTPITGGTVVATATAAGTGAASLDDVVYNLPAGTIPFTFTFNGTGYTGLNVTTNGSLTFGTTAPGTTYTPISATTAYDGAIAPLARDLQGVVTAGSLGEIRYETVGTAPNRTFVVQWSNFRVYNGTDNFAFQVRLNETSNTTQMVYGPFTVTSTTATVQVGLRGATNADYNNRTTATSWAATTAGTSNAATMPLTTTVFPATGLTYTFTPPGPTDAGIAGLAAPVAPFAAGSQPVGFVLRNYGSAPLTSVVINYSINGVAQTPYTFTGTIAAFGSQNVTVGNFTFPAGVSTITATTVLTGDSNSANDSFTTTVAPGLSGAYTINSASPTAGTNFASFTDAANALNNYGLLGAVTFAVSGGPFTEQFLLNQVPGSSATNTIVVNGGGRTIRFASANTNQRAVVQLNGTDYTTISNLVIDATGGGTAGTYGFGILLTNAADNDRIANCTVNADLGTASSNFTGIAVNGSVSSATTNGSASASNLVIEGNTIIGGYYGITLIGNSATSLNSGIIARNNTVRDFYLYGIYAGYLDGAQIIGNDINRALRTVSLSTFYGVYLFGSSRSTAIEKNRIHDFFNGATTSTSTGYGFFITTGTGATATTTNDLVNNLVYNMNGSGSQYGIYNLTSAYSRIYNNTISADDQASTATATYTTYGIYNSGANTDVKNNIVSITRTGANVKYGLYYTVATTTSNYNNIYVPAGNVGYYTTAYPTLANWQTANTNAFDQNSVSAAPTFVNPATGNFAPTNVALNNVGTPLARVTDDITGAVRGAAPDLGAYEFTPVAIDLAPVSLVGPAAGTSCFSATEAIIVQVRNAGTVALAFATNPATVTVVVTPPTGAAQTFTGTVTTGTLASGATQNVTLTGTLNMTALGTYGFAVTATVTGDANTTNDVLTPAPSITVAAPTAGTLVASVSSLCVSGTATLTLTGSANGTLQLQSSSSATGTFTNVTGATSATFTTPVLTATTYYRVQTICNTTVTSNVVAVTVTNPVVATTNTPVAICAGSTATLTATATTGNSVRFFTTATGGTALTTTTAGSYTTPALTASTTYYAEAFTGGLETVGAAAFNSTGQTPQTGGAMYFTTTAATSIASVVVYLNAGQAAGTVTIDLRTGSSTAGTVVNGQSTAFPVPAGPATGVAPYTIPLNYTVPAAGTYTLYLASATQGGLLRDPSGTNTTGYPYTSPSGVVSITAASLVGYYYYFYNWQVGGECVSATRTPIQVNVSTPVANAGAARAVCSGVSTTLGAAAITGTTYSWSPATGLSSATVANPTVTLTNTTATPTTTTYTLTATLNGCVATSTVVVTVNPRPAAPVLTATYNGTTTTLTSSATTGNQFYLNGQIITGATNQTYVITGAAAQLGSYTVVVTNANGCSSTASNVLIVTASKTGIAGASLRVFPNPTPTGQVTLEMSGLRVATQLTVFDALGRAVASETLPATSGVVTHSLDLSQMAKGVYTLRLTNTDGVETRRLVRN